MESRPYRRILDSVRALSDIDKLRNLLLVGALGTTKAEATDGILPFENFRVDG